MRRSVEIEPTTLNLNSLGDLYMRARRYDSAIAALRRSVETDSSVPGPQRRLIVSYERIGKYAEAIAARRAFGDVASAGRFARALAEGGAAGYQRERRAQLTRLADSLIAAMSLPYTLPADTISGST